MREYNKFLKSLVDSVQGTAKQILSDPEFKKVYSNYFTGSDGPKVIKRHKSQHELFVRKIFYGFTEIQNCLDRIKQTAIFLKNYDACKKITTKGITKSAYLIYHIEKYLEEMYVLKERLVVYLTVLERSHKNTDSEMNKRLKKLSDRIQKSFAGIVSTRGVHIHRNRFTDDDLSRLVTYDFLLKVGGMPEEFEKISKIEFNKVVKQWCETIKKQPKRIKKNNRPLFC